MAWSKIVINDSISIDLLDYNRHNEQNGFLYIFSNENTIRTTTLDVFINTFSTIVNAKFEAFDFYGDSLYLKESVSFDRYEVHCAKNDNLFDCIIFKINN